MRGLVARAIRRCARAVAETADTGRDLVPGRRVRLEAGVGLPLMNIDPPPPPMWERDYLRELFGRLDHRMLDLDATAAVRVLLDRRPAIIWNSNRTSAHRIRRVIRRQSPSVLVHLSDEWGTKNADTMVYRNVPLVLRQYFFPRYTPHHNCRVIPLGYMAGMFDGRPSTEVANSAPPIGARPFQWSFVGAMKADRDELLRAFTALNVAHRVRTDGGVTAPEMREIYRQSVFVPSGRGNVRLDCFRLYEASICGAIPVVVGDEQEIADTFRYGGRPPWLFARTWREAAAECRRAAEQPSLLEQQQAKIVRWWCDEIRDIQRLLDLSAHPDATGASVSASRPQRGAGRGAAVAG